VHGFMCCGVLFNGNCSSFIEQLLQLPCGAVSVLVIFHCLRCVRCWYVLDRRDRHAEFVPYQGYEGAMGHLKIKRSNVTLDSQSPGSLSFVVSQDTGLQQYA
jgi:hypothetical protein